MMNTTKHYELKLVRPDFDSTLTGLVVDLEGLRYPRIEGTTPPLLFDQLKSIFHLLESIGSARIEGNNTTVAEYMETKIEEERGHQPENIREIENLERAMVYIEEYIEAGRPINETFLKSLQQMAVEGLSREGDKDAGDYRKHNVSIKNAAHTPPDTSLVPGYMDELFSFLRKDNPPRYDLIKLAQVHHRFAWVHPFGNGNGRTVRLFTYALLLSYGYGAKADGRLINPTAVFCNDREQYYRMLAIADTGDDEGILQWCEYVLGGLKVEIEKIDRLSNYRYVQTAVLMPSLVHALRGENITKTEYEVLSIACRQPEIQNADIAHLFEGNKVRASRQINSLLEKKMLRRIEGSQRKYSISFANNYLLRGVIVALSKEGFLPVSDLSQQ